MGAITKCRTGKCRTGKCVFSIIFATSIMSAMLYIFIMRSYTRYTQTQTNDNDDNNNKGKKEKKKKNSATNHTNR